MIIKAFNLVFFMVVAVIILLTVGLYFLLRNKSEKVKIITLSSLSIFNIVFFFIYKYWLSVDPEFLIVNELDKFNWWAELPLQLCNISMFMIPVGLILKNDLIKSYIFFISPIAALMAVCFPETAFTNSSIFLLRNIGFYTTHGLIIILGINVGALKLYKPTYKGITKPLITAGILAVVMFIVNTILRNTICPQANYFFTYQNELPILSTFYSLIPVPLLYEVLTVFIIVPYCLLLVFLINLFGKLKKKKVAEE